MTVGRVQLSEVLYLDIDEVPVDRTGEYPSVGVRSFGRGLFHKPVVRGVESSYSRLFRLRAGQVVLSRLFGWEGAVALVTPEFAGHFVSPEFPTFSVREAVALPDYIGHFVRWGRFHDAISGTTRGLGQRRQRIHAEDFLALEVQLPPMEEQLRVAAWLDGFRATIGRAVAHRNRAERLLAAARVGLTRFSESDEAADLPGPGAHPLGEVLTPSTSIVPVDVTSTYWCAGIYSFGRGLIDRGSLSGLDTTYKHLTRLVAGDVVFSKLNGWEGAIAVVPEEFEGAHVSPEYPVFRADPERLLPGFFEGIARAPGFWSALDSSTRGSMVRRRRISAADFLAVPVPLPSIDEQRRVAERVRTLKAVEVLTVRASNRIDALLPSAMNEAFADIT